MKRGTENVASNDLSDAAVKITKFGKILRATSIDELPQLLNILNGSMSLITSRPLIPEEKEIRELRQKYNVYSVRPGITGWAQVNGRDNVSVEKRLCLTRNMSKSKAFCSILKFSL